MNTDQTIAISQLPSADHDLLIEIRTEMKGLKSSFNDFHASLVARIVKLETQQETTSLYHAGLPMEEFKANSAWVSKIRANWHLIGLVGGVIMFVAGSLLSNIVTKWLHI